MRVSKVVYSSSPLDWVNLGIQPASRQTTRLACASNYHAAFSASDMALPAGSPHRQHRLDGHARGSVSRAARFLPPQERRVPLGPQPQVLLPVYLRVLFQPRVAATFLVITRYKLLYADWRGYLVSLFALVYVSNFYIGLLGHVKTRGQEGPRRDQGHRSRVRYQESRGEESGVAVLCDARHGDDSWRAV